MKRSKAIPHKVKVKSLNTVFMRHNPKDLYDEHTDQLHYPKYRVGEGEGIKTGQGIKVTRTLS